MSSLRKYAMLIATLLLCVFLLLFFRNLRPRFEKVEADYVSSPVRAVNLSRETTSAELSQILISNGYVSDPVDAGFIADTLVARLKRGVNYPNLYYLQKRDYGKVPALVADSVGVLVEKVAASYEKIGVKDSLPEVEFLRSEFDYSIDTTRRGGTGEMTVYVYEKEEISRGKFLDKLLKPKKEKKPCKDVLVCLKEHYIGMQDPEGELVGYAKTDDNGCAVFTHLDKSKGYSVLPIKKGFEYGSSKGVVEGNFDKHKYLGLFGKEDHIFSFEQLEHRIQMIDNLTLKQIKNDGTITIRTPEKFKAEVIKWFIFVVLGWWLLAAVLVRRKRNFDPVLLAAAMLLTGLCVIVMFAIQNPLTEDMRGVEMASGVLMGLGMILLLQFVNFKKMYQDGYKLGFDIPLAIIRWLFLPFKQKVAWLAPVLSGSAPWYKKLGAMLLLLCCLPFAIFNIPYVSKINKPILRLVDKMPKGFGWLLLALALTALLWTPLGKEIGGMKVNLSLFGLTFQPSEIAKYLILFFVAAFFTQHADTIIAYSQPNRTQALGSVWSKVKTLGWVITGLLLLMAMYFALGDMGPGLVIGITFVLLYSLVKSKVNLDNLTEEDKWKRILTCDFAMLIYGVITFALFIFIGFKWNGAETAMLFAILWFVAWVIFGISFHKQLFETAIIINLLVFIFIFGGDVMRQSSIPALRDSDIAERFEQRTRMCSNTWGDLNIDHHQAKDEPVSNTQVANGLWAIATGGMTGQGLGDGNPNLIPAFHTDMILSSMAEQIGWWGLALVVFVFALLLRRIIVIGYRVGHPFAFYFCMGVAIVTGVQFFVIALGSSGMIPLTGITVPFLSYGRVSMILNLTALGVVLSLSQNIKQEELSETQEQIRRRSVGDYNYPISIVTWTYIVIALFALCVWQYYALWARNNTLVKPAYVLSNTGWPIIEYNPRIALLTKEMWAGNIYDRNGVLLATSDKDKLKDEEVLEKLTESGLTDTDIERVFQAHSKRYYPFAEHLFFMLGDQNTGLFFSYSEDNPIGFMAEAQYLSYLRDYDDNLRDKAGNIVKTALHGKLKADSRYVDRDHRLDTVVSIRVRDNHELVEYLKTGVNGRPLRKHNEKVQNGKFDLQLTVDAKLQMDLQNRIADFMQNQNLADKNLTRVSVVVLDAETGDMLTSANYPLPDQNRLRVEEENAWNRGEKFSVYTDNYKDKNWQAYTDRDLGLTFQSQPGSTAKVMSAMAGFMKIGPAAAGESYMIYKPEIIDTKLGEPGKDGNVNVSLRTAIVESSNCYFVNSVHDMDLYQQLGEIYKAVGVRIDREVIDKRGRTIVDKSLTPYFLYAKDISDTAAFNAEVAATGQRGIRIYNNYIAQRTRTHRYRKMNWSQCAWAWGQGTLRATPLNMARVASIVVNDGTLANTRFLLNEPQTQTVVCATSLEQLRTYMEEQASNKGKISNPNIGGKTGTPERSYMQFDKKGRKEQSRKNDAWYIFFVDSDGVNQDHAHKLAVAVRIERTKFASGLAMRLTRDKIIPSLTENNYMR